MEYLRCCVRITIICLILSIGYTFLSVLMLCLAFGVCGCSRTSRLACTLIVINRGKGLSAAETTSDHISFVQFFLPCSFKLNNDNQFIQ